MTYNPSNSALAKFSYVIVALLLLSISLGVHARAVTVTGSITNLESKNINPAIRIYLPGYPFVGSDKTKLWRTLGTTSYDAVTGKYTIEVNVPDSENDILVAASYKNGSYDITKHVNIASVDAIIVDIALPVNARSELSFIYKIFFNDIEYDYALYMYSCMLANTALLSEGRVILSSLLGIPKYKNEIYDLPAGDYVLACSIENISGIQGDPPVIRRFKQVTLPLLDNNGQALPKAERVIELRFGSSSVNGTAF